jgi:hypothetical protein
MKYWSLGLGVFILIFILVLVGRDQDDSAAVAGTPQKVFPAPAAGIPQQVFPVPVAGTGRGVNSPRPRVSQVTVDSPGAEHVWPALNGPFYSEYFISLLWLPDR